MGAEAAQEEKDKAALHQQGEVGGNAGGGRHQDDRIPWEREHREVRADRDEHGESWSSQWQSHQVPGDAAMRRKDHWACQGLIPGGTSANLSPDGLFPPTRWLFCIAQCSVR